MRPSNSIARVPFDRWQKLQPLWQPIRLASRSKFRTHFRQRTTRGVMWVAAQAGATRIITFTQQILLGAGFWRSDDFGLIGLAYTVTSL